MANTCLYNNFFSRSNKKGGANTKQLKDILNKKKGLLVATFANLIFQLGVTFYVMENYVKLIIIKYKV